MGNNQANQFLVVLRAACGNGQLPLDHPDWDYLAQLAHIHTLTALFYAGASQYADFSDWAPEHRETLRRETIAQVGGQTMRTQCFLSLYQSLLEAGLRPLVLKGIVCRSLYGPLADWRPSSDEDVYLPPEQVERCRQVLEENGWRLSSHEDSLSLAHRLQEIAFDSDQSLRHLELHPTLFGEDDPDRKRCSNYFQNIDGRAVSITVEGQRLYTLGYTDHYLYLFLHLAKHLKGNGVGIRQILDLMQFQRAWGANIDWVEVRRVIPRLSSPELYADVVELGRRMGFEEADPLFDTLQPELLLEDSLEGGIYGFDREGQGRGVIVARAAQYPTWLGRLRRLLFPSAQQLLEGRPWLEKKPWLLPVAWVQRAGRLFHSGDWGRVTLESLQVSRRRLGLLRSYGLLPGGKTDAKTREQTSKQMKSGPLL